MGAAASIEPELFNDVKAEYEAKKAAGVSDEELFEAMKVFIETRSTAKSADADEVPPTEEAAAPSVEEAKPVEDGEAAGGAEVEAVPAEAEAVAAE